MQAFGTQKKILIEPVFAQWIQASQGKTAYGFDYFTTSSAAYSASQSLWLPGWLEAISNTNSLFLTIGPGDFLVHHIALGLHTTTLILVKVL
jgi:photosystem I P700 chlorophyll a apoprotein A2